MTYYYDIVRTTLTEPIRPTEARYLLGGLVDMRRWVGYRVAPVLTRITTVPQRSVRLQRTLIRNPERWAIHEVRIGGASILKADLPMRGDAFCDHAFEAGEPLIPYGTAVEISVEYLGDLPDGEQLMGTLLCVDPDASPSARIVIPLSTSVAIRPADHGWRYLVEIGDRVFRFDERHRILDRIALATHAELDTVCRHISEIQRGGVITIDGLVIDRFEAVTVNRVVSIHVGEIGTQVGSTLTAGGLAVFGIDEETGATLFAITGGTRPFSARCDPSGFLPEWFGELPDLSPDPTVERRQT